MAKNDDDNGNNSNRRGRGKKKTVVGEGACCARMRNVTRSVHGQTVHQGACLYYIVSCWLTCCCCLSSQVVVVATAAAATAKPPTHSGHRHHHRHLHRRCHRNRIGCSYHRRPHLAANFIAVIDAVIAPAAASTMQIP